ncbi:MAG: hypothetical protein CMB57_06475 [Euryarchaeota archaeon]|nr:hypothetical protein [Euryarchaeota archaeon]
MDNVCRRGESTFPTDVMKCLRIGRPNFHRCETHKHEVAQTNVLRPINVVEVAHGIHVTSFATGCIYAYNEERPLGSGRGFTEDDAPNFRGSYYSNTKAMVEELIKAYDKVFQLRLRMTIDDDLVNPRTQFHPQDCQLHQGGQHFKRHDC